MEHAHMQEAERLINGLKLAEDCKGYIPGFGVSCKARDIGLKSYVKCLEKDSCRCPFSVSYAHSHYCTCSVRIHMTKKLKK